MRVVHVSDCYPPRTGGIESQVGDLAARQVAAGDEVHVFTATPGEDGSHGGQVELRDGVRVHRMGTRLPFDMPVNPVSGPKLLRSGFGDVAPDVVHVHAGMVSPFAFDGARLAIASGLPTVITWHCMLDGMLPALRLGARTTSWNRVPAALTAVSAAAAKRVADVFDAPVEVLRNGLDMAQWRPAGGSDRSGEHGPLRLVATMRMAPRKRAVPLVQIVARAARTLPPDRLRLTLIGSGPSLGRVRSTVAELGLDRSAELTGRLDRAAVHMRYADADVFLAPAELEAFGIAALEARASGLVVVGRKGTGLAEFVQDGVDGLLVDGDRGMTEAIVTLARDGELLARLKAHNRAVTPTFDWVDVIESAREQYGRAREIAAHAG
ncbi:MAG: glycosyltransferase family 4 protein [Actinobacteria bacterium]|nr:glycosyltransferase family 4 protein [Actinomycetota bacterium]MCG2798487.1 glycosyltransferase family 4 protein [Cellulomonas sp.]